MNDKEFFNSTTCQYQIRALSQKVREFETGERYVKMQEEFRSVFHSQNRAIKTLRDELARAHAETVTVRKIWSEVMDDLESEHRKEILSLQREIDRLKTKLLNTEKERDELLNKNRDRNRELCVAKNALYEAEEKIKGLDARINKDYTNSSKPSSQSPNHKTIPNGRQKSGNKPGGQIGHEHHPRKFAKSPDRIIDIPAPPEYTEDPNFKETGRIISKQLVKLHVRAEVIEYKTPEFRNQSTGQRVHASFPDGLVDDVTYDGTVKAFAYLLNNECYVSIGKTGKLIREISHGRLDLSSGLICNLSRQFSEKTKAERDEIFLRLYSSPTMHADFTFGRMSGKQTAVIICASGDDVLYQGREKKGDEGVKDSPLELYDGILISDHEAALIKHGSQHQECMEHVKRYAISSIENEKELTWNVQMKAWLDETTKYWESISEGCEKNPKLVDEYILQYDEIMETAKKEYEDDPPSQYFMEGYNLYKRMSEEKEAYTLFLTNPAVEPNNNLAERCARKFKRKAAQVMCFRSQNGVDNFCDGLSIIQSLKAKGENLYDAASQRFNKRTEA